VRKCKTSALDLGSKAFQKLSQAKTMPELADHIIETCDIVAAAPLVRLATSIEDLKQQNTQQFERLELQSEKWFDRLELQFERLEQEMREQRKEMQSSCKEIKKEIDDSITRKLGIFLGAVVLLLTIVVPASTWAQSPAWAVVTALLDRFAGK
jgi:tetrahydromethanopterin S-methyltransferase subunit G